MVEVYDAFADGQADAGTVRPTPGGVFYLLKFLKNFALVLDFYTDAIILNINLHLFVTGCQSDGYFSAIGIAKFDSI